VNAPLWIDEATLHSVLPYAAAVASLDEVLRQPGATSGTPPRQIVGTASGQVLLMPAEIPPFAGVKVVTVAPGNPALGLPRVNGVYVLFDSATLRPVAQFDAAALTAVRTAAVSALAVDRLAIPGAFKLAVIGAGPQARAHITSLAAVRPLQTVVVVARTPGNAQALLRHASNLGLGASAVDLENVGQAVGRADIVACCTTARDPLFDSNVLRSDATIVAVGSHEPDVRELDAALIRRATVVVESRRSAETAGDIVLAASPGVDAGDLVAGDLIDLVAGRIVVESGRPRVFKSVGEAWQDLVVAAAAYSRV